MLVAQVIGNIEIGNAKEVFWEIISVDQHGTAKIQRSNAGELTAEDATSVWPPPGRPARTPKKINSPTQKPLMVTLRWSCSARSEPICWSTVSSSRARA